ncbi:lipase class 3 [Nitzschia inconspicua]|uniref:Lipase class 3 n=1 Tax=Nitzschia inconspicua TaxID=303405 RepID=A0A9K3L7Z3_9STRA|nr:lipase class 3 [Nitzschia inconspicua]
MFHRPAPAVVGGGNENAIQARPTGNNENLIPHRQLGTQKSAGNENEPTKTPRASSRRRVLGDISNKKKTGLGGKGGVAPLSNRTQPLKPRSSNIVWQPTANNNSSSDKSFPRKTGNEANQNIVGGTTMSVGTKTAGSKIPKLAPHPRGTGNNTSKIDPKAVTLMERPSQQTKQMSTGITRKTLVQSTRPVLAPLSNKTNIPKSSLSSVDVHKSIANTKKYNFRVEEPVPDIELPAGRTWKQQLEYDLKIDDDDVASTSSIDDVLLESLDRRSMWDDWKETMRKSQKEEAEKLDRIIQEGIEAVLEQDQRDYELGIECLCDNVNSLDIFGSTSDIDLGIKDDSDDNDEWSLPASSLCGPEAEDSFFKFFESTGRSDTAEFAEVCSHFLGYDGIVEIAFSDILAGLYVTRLIHRTVEIAVTQQLDQKVLTSSLVRNEVRYATGQVEALRDAVRAKPPADGTWPTSIDRAFQQIFELDGFIRRLSATNKPEDRVRKTEDGCQDCQISQAVDSDEDPGRAPPGVVVIETKIQQANNFLIPLINTRLCEENENEVFLLAEGARYLSFATNIYDWSVKDRNSWYDWRPRPTQTCGHGSDHSGKAMKVRPIYCVEEEDIVYANYKAGIVAAPFAVVLDHAWDSVVVTIRGSASMGDFFCDLNFFQRSLEDYGNKYDFDGKGKFAHRGIVACSAWITEDLLRVQVLEDLLLNEDAEYKHYQLRIVGHSLGATAACLVSLFLRSRFPECQGNCVRTTGLLCKLESRKRIPRMVHFLCDWYGCYSTIQQGINHCIEDEITRQPCQDTRSKACDHVEPKY